MTTDYPDHDKTISILRLLLAEHGLRATIVFLNGLTRFRFTAVYRFDQATLKNVCFFDRNNALTDTLPDIPITSSYCTYVRDFRHVFLVPDADSDARVALHPKRHEVKAYCGVPLMDHGGNVVGTICHFNLSPIDTRPAEAELLMRAAQLIMEMDLVSA